MIQVLEADWPAPASVKAFTTLRGGGVSKGVYKSLNLAAHVGDVETDVRVNREKLKAFLSLPGEPVWLNQVHGSKVVDAATTMPNTKADGAFTLRPGVVCVVLTADCLPLFLCNRQGTEVALLHVGWRGLAAGIIQAGITKMQSPPTDLLAWLGPAIGANAFEVGCEVKDQLMQAIPDGKAAFKPSTNQNRYMANLYALCRLQLQVAGVKTITSSDRCTHTQDTEYFSHRRDGVCGRMASMIWRIG